MKTNSILIINNGLSGGGIERASASLANHFAQLGIGTTVLALYKSEHFFRLHPPVKFIEPRFNRNKMNRYAYVLKMLLFIRNSIRQIKPGAILAFSEWTNPYVILSNIGLGIPLYVSDRMNPLAKLPFTSLVLKKLLYKWTDGIIAQTALAKDILQKETKAENIIVIPNPVNAIDKIPCEQKKRIVTVGRLSPEKGHKYLLKAFALMKNSDWELSIVGDGIERDELEKLALHLGVADRVLFHGQLQDFRQQLSEAQIFVLPSLKEGFPNALLEAMSIPLACVSTKFSDGKNEIIENGINGLVVNPGNSEELSAAMELLIFNQGLREKLAKKAFNVRDDYNFDKVAAQYLNFISGNHE